MKNKGYTYINFKDDSKEAVKFWSKSIPEKYFAYLNVNDKIIGGNVTDKLHLTLFFGLNDIKINKTDLDNTLNAIKISEIKVSGLKVFNAFYGNNKYKILTLEVEDSDNILKISNEKFLDFEYIEDENTFNYKPHITIGYMSQDFDINSIYYNGPNILKVDSIKYKIKD